MSRLATVFDSVRAAKRPGLVAYVTAGDPDLHRSRDVVRAIDRAGADVIELGVPFSDPVADGPAIQRASDRALSAGGNLTETLRLAGDLKGTLKAPIVLFTYVNPVLSIGLEAFAKRAAEAGVSGVLLLDLPIEESSDARAILDRAGLDQIFLISPTTSDDRLREAARLGRGFLYAISRLGVTGTRAVVADTAAPLVHRIRAMTSLPIALGFGISKPEHVRDVGAYADAAVVGSALVEAIERASAAGRDPAAEAAALITALRGGHA